MRSTRAGGRSRRGSTPGGFLGTQLIAPPPPPLALGAAPVADLPADLRRQARRVGPQLPTLAQTHLTNILAAASAIEPKLRAIDPANPSVISVRQIMADYIPTTLDAYAALAPRLRSVTKLSDGRTADEQITDQLALLEKQMDQVVDNLSRGDLMALETQGRFLDEKFRSSDPLRHGRDIGSPERCPCAHWRGRWRLSGRQKWCARHEKPAAAPNLQPA